MLPTSTAIPGREDPEVCSRMGCGLQKWISARRKMRTLDAINPRVIQDCLASQPSLSENLTLLDERAKHSMSLLAVTKYRSGIHIVLCQR